MANPTNKDHAANCCVIHGCAYDEKSCAVLQGNKVQQKLCNSCVEMLQKANDTVTNLRHVAELKQVIRETHSTNVY